MSDDGEKEKKTKKPRHMLWYPEKWLHGSLRDEFTASQRGVWADLLSKAGCNDPPGQIDFTSIRSLARQLIISPKLLYGTLRQALLNKKIRIIKVYVNPNTGGKFEENELTLSEVDTFCSKKQKSGVGLFAIIFINWDNRQPPYYRQKLYPKKQVAPHQTGAVLGPKNAVIIGEERRIQDNRINTPPTETPSISPLPSSPKKEKTLKEEFLETLKGCRGYPFKEAADSLLFDVSITEHPGINILEQTTKKIAWWKDHPDALKADARAQLKTWFSKEAEFKDRGGPQKIGDIMPEVKDPDHRRFLNQYLTPRKKRLAVEGETG